MFRPLFSLWLLAYLTFGACPAAVAESPDVQPSEQQKHVRLLTVGNSFTQNATRYLDEIAEAAGQKLTHKMLSIGGSPLELHAAHLQTIAHQAAQQGGDVVISHQRSCGF